MGRVLAVIIWIITLLSVLLFVAGKWWFPEAISEHAPALDRQFMITIVVVGISFTDGEYGLPAIIGTAVAVATGPVMYRLARDRRTS